MFVVILILLACLGHVLALHPNGTHRIKIGVAVGNSESDPFMYGGVVAIEMQARYLNAIPSLIHPNATIEIIYRDTDFQRGPTIEAALELKALGIAGFIGASYSRLTTLASLVLNPFKIPMCCGSSTSPVLSNKVEYPNFFRTVPNDNQQATVFADTVRHFGWKKVCEIAVNDEYGQGLANEFMSEARLRGIQVLSTIYVKVSTTDVSQEMQAAKNTGARIFLFFGTVGEFRYVAREARTLGLWQKGYSWIMAEALATFTISNADDLALIEGSFIVSPVEGQGDRYENFVQRWANSRNQSYLWPDIKRDVRDLKEPPNFSMFFTSCLELYVYGFHNLIKDPSKNVTIVDLASGAANAKFLIPQTFNVTNATVTGTVKLDANGERKGAYVVINTSNGASKNALYWSDGNITQLLPVMFPGGESTVPLDEEQFDRTAKYMPIGSAEGVLTIIIGVCGIMVCVATCVILAIYRTHKFVKITGLFINCTILFALCLCFMALFLTLGRPNTSSCIGETWLITLSFSLVYGMLLVKSIRIYSVFVGIRFAPTLYIKDRFVIWAGVALSLPNLLLLSIWSSADPPFPEVILKGTGEHYWACKSKGTLAGPVLTILILYNALIILLGTFFSVKTRKAPSQFRESALIGICTYNVAVFSLLGVILLNSAVLGFYARFWIKWFVLVYCLFSNLGILFVKNLPNLLGKSTGGSSNKDIKPGSHHLSTNRPETMASPMPPDSLESPDQPKEPKQVVLKTHAAIVRAISAQTLGAAEQFELKGWTAFGKALCRKRSWIPFLSYWQMKYIVYSEQQNIFCLLDQVTLNMDRGKVGIGQVGSVVLLKNLQEFSVNKYDDGKAKFFIDVEMDQVTINLLFEDPGDWKRWGRIFDSFEGFLALRSQFNRDRAIQRTDPL